jgi:hypothetical protein
MACKVGSFAKSTGAATVAQAVTGVGFQPWAVILWTVGATSADTWTDGYLAAYGFAGRKAAGTITQGSCAWASQDNQGTSNCSQRAATKALTIVQWDETLLAECDLASFDSDGFTLSWTTNDAAAYIINYMALGGVSMTNAAVLPWAFPASTGAFSVTGAGATPDCVLHTWIGAAGSLPVTAAGIRGGIGAMDTAKQWHQYWSSRDAQGSNVTYQHASASFAIYAASISSGILDLDAAYTSMDADGFTCAVSHAGANEVGYSLCLTGGSYYVGDVILSATGTAPVDTAITAVAFLPDALLVAPGYNAGSGTNNCAGDCGPCLGATDGTNERAAIFVDDNGADTSNTAGLASATNLYLSDSNADQTTGAEGDIKSFDATGFTVTRTKLEALYTPYFACNGGAIPSTGLPIAKLFGPGFGFRRGVPLGVRHG